MVSLRRALLRGESLQSTTSRDSAELDTAATHYTGAERGKYKLTREFRKRFTLHGVVDRLLRKTVRRNTWIYVSHSSLLAGGNGVIHTLSPLSGHYRTQIEHFRQFIDVLNERGVDMTKAKISKAEIALWGIGHIKRVQKSKQRMLENGKQGISDTLHKVGDKVGNVTSISWKREVLEGRRKEKSNPDAEGYRRTLNFIPANLIA
ncbi:hypothetical protein C8F04DRAFT_1090143, partial [Mycena alexandri]